MFCTNCGKEIIDTAKFCNFCGSPVKNLTTSYIPPVQPVRQAQPVQHEPISVSEPDVSAELTNGEMSGTGETVPENAVSPAGAPEESVEFSEPTITDELTRPDVPEPAEPEQSERSEHISDSVFPRPNVIPTVGESASLNYAPPIYPNVPVAPDVPVAPEASVVPVQSAVPEARPERKYTFGHIMMCLAAVAVMAIVAGVFAGLYFSVV